MKKLLPLAAASLLLSSLCAAQEVRYEPEPDFNSIVSRSVEKLAPADAFAAPQCAVVDAKFVQAVSLKDAQKLLAPCLDAIAARYDTKLTVREGTVSEQGRLSAQVESLIIDVPAGESKAGALVRDLNHGLALRQNLLMGHPVVVRRRDQKVSVESTNPAQDALSRCLMPMVLRRIESGSDFIQYYGGCLRQDDSLKIVDLKPWSGHPMGVIVVTGAARPVAESLDTSVSVAAANGPVQIDLVAYTQPVFRP